MFARLRRYINQEVLWLKLSHRFILSHHPLCEPYSSQRFDIFGMSFCQGCSIIIFSVIGSFFLFIGIKMQLFIELYLLWVFALIITVLGDGIIKKRWSKRLARLVIGTALGVALAQLFLNPIINSLFILGTIILTYYAYQFFRSFTPAKDLCQTCPELKDAPRCSGIKHQFGANLKYQELVFPVLNSNKINQLQANLDTLNPIDNGLESLNLPGNVKITENEEAYKN